VQGVRALQGMPPSRKVSCVAIRGVGKARVGCAHFASLVATLGSAALLLMGCGRCCVVTGAGSYWEIAGKGQVDPRG